jgi:cytochrome c-type biogenesis protein CcmH/NrfG
MKSKTFAAILVLSLCVTEASSQSSGKFGGRSQITGIVRYANGNSPAENVLVRLEAYTGGNVGDVQTDRSGKFVFTGLAGQEYDLTVVAPGYLPAKQYVDLQTVLTAFVQIQLIPDKQAPLPDSKSNLSTIDARVPDSARKELEKARSTLEKPGKMQETISHLQKAVSISPDFAEAELLLGTVYMDTQQWDKAQAPLQQALRAKPDSLGALLALGELYLHAQKYKEAEDTLSNALHLDDSSFRGHLALGRVYYAAGDLTKAGPEIDRAIQLNPNFAEANLLAGNIRFKSRQADKALLFFEEYLRLQPDGPYAKETRDLVLRIKKALGLP